MASTKTLRSVGCNKQFERARNASNRSVDHVGIIRVFMVQTYQIMLCSMSSVGLNHASHASLEHQIDVVTEAAGIFSYVDFMSCGS